MTFVCISIIFFSSEHPKHVLTIQHVYIQCEYLINVVAWPLRFAAVAFSLAHRAKLHLTMKLLPFPSLKCSVLCLSASPGALEMKVWRLSTRPLGRRRKRSRLVSPNRQCSETSWLFMEISMPWTTRKESWMPLSKFVLIEKEREEEES